MFKIDFSTIEFDTLFVGLQETDISLDARITSLEEDIGGGNDNS